MTDLIVLVPDKNVKFGIDGLFSRFESLNIKKFSYDIFVHPLHDPGVYNDSANFLRQFSNQYSYALVFLDHEGSGQEEILPGNIEVKIKEEIERNGWQNRVGVIIFEPELEVWVWAESKHTADVLGWKDYLELKEWLITQGVWEQNASKPKRPKEAVEIVLKRQRMPRSSSIYQEIAKSVKLDKCQDKSFIRLRDILRTWFPRKE